MEYFSKVGLTKARPFGPAPYLAESGVPHPDAHKNVSVKASSVGFPGRMKSGVTSCR